MDRKYQRTVSTSSWRSASRPGGLIITPKWGTWQHTWEVGEPFTTPNFFRTKWSICSIISCLNMCIYIYRHSLSLMIIVNMKYNIHISMCMYIYISYVCVYEIDTNKKPFLRSYRVFLHSNVAFGWNLGLGGNVETLRLRFRCFPSVIQNGDPQEFPENGIGIFILGMMGI